MTLLWLTAGHSFAVTQPAASEEKGAQSLGVLNDARIDALQARGDENITLVARGGAGRKYESGHVQEMRTLAGERASGSGGGDRGEDGDRAGGGGLLGEALRPVRGVTRSWG